VFYRRASYCSHLSKLSWKCEKGAEVLSTPLSYSTPYTTPILCSEPSSTELPIYLRANTMPRTPRKVSPPTDNTVPSSRRTVAELLGSLPAELLSYIFELGAVIDEEEGWKDEDEKTERTGVSKLPFQYVVASTCKSWRATILALPTLWTTFRFDMREGVIHRDVICDLLGRSKAAPLMIELTLDELRVTDDPNIDPSEAAESIAIKLALELFECLISHAWHWSVFRLQCLGVALDHLEAFFYLLYQAPAAPILRELEVHVYEEDDDEELTVRHVEPQKLFGGAPLRNLEILSLARSPFPWSPVVFGSFFQPSLREIHLLKYFNSGSAPSITVLLEALRECPNLEVLDLYHSGPTEPIGDWPLALEQNKIILPKLRSAHLAGMRPEHMRRLFDLVSTPSLTDLRLWLNAVDVHNYDEFLQNCISPVVLFPTVERLELSGGAPIESAVLQRFLGAHPQVVDFTMQLPEFKDQLSILAYHHPLTSTMETADSTVLEQILLPKMHTLRVTALDRGQPAPGLVAVLQTRAAALCPVHTLFIDAKLAAPDHTSLKLWVEKIEYFELEEDGDDDSFMEDDAFENASMFGSDDSDLGEYDAEDVFDGDHDEDWF